jgi:hypothetical protein
MSKQSTRYFFIVPTARCYASENTGRFKKSFTTLKAHIHLFKDMDSVMNCHNVVKHVEFHLGQFSSM